MTATDSPVDPLPKSCRRFAWWLIPAVPIGLVVGVSWWLTEPLEDRPTSPPEHPAGSGSATRVPARPLVPPRWPEGRLEGDAAKRLLLASAEVSTARLGEVEGYTATLRKRERIGGRLGPEQTLSLKIRNKPFAIYLKFLAPKEGKEVVYAEGHHDNQVIAHNGDWTRRLVPRLKVAPDSALALADSRHPVTEAGLVHLAELLLKFRRLDVDDPDARTVLDQFADSDGHQWLRSVHTHTIADGTRPFARVEICYDPATQYPLRIRNYDWPGPGHSGELELAESFAYDALNLDAKLTPTDFDPANPDYAFMRF